ncbi:hypothetical protein ASG12_20150 [Williamsia sp. Leaf354]|uniref:nucleoside 2-deoxyribosyltransferase n=1 Tax=Williamsia sp. Leaf354 TaxID=1736349 RepID=UPI0006F9A023|nr:nucleoside 2-deoxyribosyltransferase [Williamsia sp. Leaf354]KQR96717.1 hypothetical protein ASG12_20150 [Williamsia sp. Leaf354]
MKVYFAGSIRAGRDDVPVYEQLISRIKGYGEVLTEHVGDYRLSVKGQHVLSDTFIHDRDVEWLLSSQVVIAETTVPSLGVGYEIALATAHGIPVIALHRGEQGDLSAMIAGSGGVTTHFYTDISEALTIIDDYFSQELAHV